MYRYSLDYLHSWSAQIARKPIVIRGARQVGKSSLVRIFAETARLELCDFNFEQYPEKAELFGSSNPGEIIKLINLDKNILVVPGKTLLFLDEIQSAPQLLRILRYFYEQMPTLHVIAAGSLLDFALEKLNFSMPVGRIEYLHLGPMTFTEFLLAKQEEQLVEFVKSYELGDEYPLYIHNKLMQLVKAYCIIGGMPEAINSYCQQDDYLIAEKSKQSILSTYKDDFNKYNTPTEQHCIRMVFNKLPRLIGEKIKFSKINPDLRAVNINTALEHLCLARVIFKVKHSASNGVPLGAEVKDKIFKIIFLDVGLLTSSLNIGYLDLQNLAELTLINSGQVAEQFIGQHLLYANPIYQEPSLYYWVRENKSANSEIDYVISNGQRVIPVEVKAGKTGTLKSLHYFLGEKQSCLGLRFNSDMPSITNNTASLINDRKLSYHLISLPLYMVEQANRILTKSA
jgi:predicted AAA+ superfamily ATPase